MTGAPKSTRRLRRRVAIVVQLCRSATDAQDAVTSSRAGWSAAVAGYINGSMASRQA
jgi:hypothetical protein